MDEFASLASITDIIKPKGSAGVEREEHKLIGSSKSQGPATFEDAITATGFGKYNFLLLFCIIFPCAIQIAETTGISYILPIAECDLNLSLEDKGILNGVTFAGMILSGLFWGYLIDALGRKQIIVYGYLTTGFFSLIAACSSNKFLLIIAKFAAGVVLNGPFSASTAHIVEFHSSKYRGKINMIRGTITSFANLLLPVLAWLILPRKIDISVFGIFELRSWNVFMLITAFGPIISGCLYSFLPDSPKFLMSNGRNREALAVMKKIYAMNTGKPEETFPIKHLAEETIQNLASTKDLTLALKSGYAEMRTIFHLPHGKNLALVSLNAFSLVLSLNTIRLWLPGIFQSINDYQMNHNGSSSDMCTMLDFMNGAANVSSTGSCNVNLDNISVYVNTFMVAAARILAFFIAGMFVQMVGTKKLTILLCFFSSTLLFCIYFAKNALFVTILSAAGSAIGSVPEILLITMTLELFPTTLRTMALSVHLMAGRLGTLIGNVTFPYLVHLGCLPPFLFIGLFGFTCGMLSSLYPSIENKPLV
ncbi:unnamed protein product [Phyllotreta striolata]|uniref:Major facilitator superfamily (MFS) profile domain-containing protein n=1 Tax=Phyllotreta striolata TaxID=444603 RepID=A0A9N9TLA2_PHYSR|nr:unnamed protein product [Phyllotreta striolata]